ncbi:DEAD/DEAH box helicase [Phenylobacterium sp. J426]|uniref:DEAD/DEAH box helicase n=1 Tax=Phenylobacterium sp. J426 TaxID=2898439 RepID=UPI002150E06B|nr:DEAD/DEAH box helicase [Phenylobacterium sp. J426]MCR5873989.1 DEAD/DEAH box helicase [Phenylobacterium sp. J426]
MPFPDTHPALSRALAARGYAEPTPVQAAILEAEPRRDLLVSAQTGSGKTVAFGLAAAPVLLDEAERFGPAEQPLALAVAPTRELALQVARELEWLYAEAGARIVTCVGGMDARREQRALAAGCHIVVGTPGRLRDHLERGNLDLSALKVVVLDEADEMLDLGFREDLEEILDATPDTRRTFLFSATLAKDIVTLARRYQQDALRIDTVRRDEPHGDIEYRAVRIAPNELENAVVNVLRYFESPSALIFCATREAVRHLYGSLRERGFPVVALSGEMGQKERSDALQSLRDGHARACVATDVAARGLDLPDLGLVIHAELPVNKATLLHRSGRTGRAGRKGVSVLLVPYTRRRKAEMLLNAAGVDVTWSGAPTVEEIRERDQVRMLEDPILTDAPSDEDLALAGKVLEGRAPEAVAAALVRLYRQRLPEPEEMFEQVPDRGPGPGAGPRERPPREPHVIAGDGVWFRLPVGRSQSADPKWLVPLICRLGHVTKKDIGQIRIFDRETKFEISQEAEGRFRAAVAANDKAEMRVEPSGPPGERPPPREWSAPQGSARASQGRIKRPWERPGPAPRQCPWPGAEGREAAQAPARLTLCPKPPSKAP